MPNLRELRVFFYGVFLTILRKPFLFDLFRTIAIEKSSLPKTQTKIAIKMNYKYSREYGFLSSVINQMSAKYRHMVFVVISCNRITFLRNISALKRNRHWKKKFPSVSLSIGLFFNTSRLVPSYVFNLTPFFPSVKNMARK